MSEYIIGNTANDVWIKAVKQLDNIDELLPCRTGKMYEIPHTFITINNPIQKWIYSRIPPISISFALAELVWIVNGKSESKIINFWNNKLSLFSGDSEYYHGAYGDRIRQHFGFDQLERAYYAFINNPDTRQVVIQIYDTCIDFPTEKGEPRDADIPCNICSILKIRNNKLEWSQIMRSNDILLGTPYNFIQYTSLQEILAGWLNIEVGTYNHYSDSLHLYERDKKRINIGILDNMINSDTLSVSKDVSDTLFKEMYRRMELIVNSDVSEEDLIKLANLNSEYEAYNNIMIIIVAYAARKLYGNNLSNKIVELCTNNLYKVMWKSWSIR
ncbi:thymidylate synthase [Thomasclavelia cocleata]|uniref:thymidylate synthase n=1 Tax=Thomasclavelia cocleata TaxID=69824 RepID=UPI0024301186|nr:thymidylate synthase [Thomasclavelia cocleata]